MTDIEKITIAPAGMKVYTFSWGDYEDKGWAGPYLGKLGLDFATLQVQYRQSSYAAAQAAREDMCFLDEGKFLAWMVDTGVLAVVDSDCSDIEISTPYDDPYIPTHWPECPQCEQGRGETEYGQERRSLNRITTFHRCTECRHEWGQVEVALNSNSQMLPDDGRDTSGGCVPYAISKACALDFWKVLEICKAHGWSESGLAPDSGVSAARELGFDLRRIRSYGPEAKSKPTLKQVQGEVSHNRNFIVGVDRHWLALVRGEIVDNDTNSGPGKKVLELYEVRAIPPSATAAHPGS